MLTCCEQRELAQNPNDRFWNWLFINQLYECNRLTLRACFYCWWFCLFVNENSFFSDTAERQRNNSSSCTGLQHLLFVQLPLNAHDFTSIFFLIINRWKNTVIHRSEISTVFHRVTYIQRIEEVLTQNEMNKRSFFLLFNVIAEVALLSMKCISSAMDYSAHSNFRIQKERIILWQRKGNMQWR